MFEKEILQALQTATIAAVAASTTPTLPVKYAGRVMPNNAGKWLETVYIPNNVNAEFWDEGKTYRGVYRLILHWPADDSGHYTPLQLLASICSYFSIGSVFQNGSVQVKITAEPDLSSVIEAAPSQLFPVSIRYQTFRR
jgi:hypothetical protein